MNKERLWTKEHTAPLYVYFIKTARFRSEILFVSLSDILIASSTDDTC
jgi:hypothetical protein